MYYNNNIFAHNVVAVFIKIDTCYTFEKNDMNIIRDIYLSKIITRRHNGMVITGLRRCGKSYKASK